MQTECFISFEPGQDLIDETDLAIEFFEICAENGMDIDRLILGTCMAISYLSEELDTTRE